MGEVKSFQIHEGGIGMSFTKDPFNGLFFIDYDPAPGTQVSCRILLHIRSRTS
jgi:hypothetical protein